MRHKGGALIPQADVLVRRGRDATGRAQRKGWVRTQRKWLPVRQGEKPQEKPKQPAP